MPAPDRRRGSTWTPEADEARFKAAQTARRRIGGATLAAVPAAGVEARDHVLVLRTSGKRFPGKRAALNADGTVSVVPHDGASLYRPVALEVGDVASLHAAFVRIAEAVDGAGIVVRGQLHADADPRTVTRRKIAKRTTADQRGRPAGLADIARWWLVVDIDKVANATLVRGSVLTRSQGRMGRGQGPTTGQGRPACLSKPIGIAGITFRSSGAGSRMAGLRGWPACPR
jgi:hypothetical protein